MFRHHLKLPILILRKPFRHPLGLSCLYRTSCIINAKEKPREDKEGPHEGGSSRAFYYTVGAVVVGTGAVIAYAKHEPDFRSWLAEKVPGSDGFIAFVTAEETSHIDFLTRKLSEFTDKMVTYILDLFNPRDAVKEKLPPCDDEQKPYVPPRSALKPLTDSKKKDQEKYDEQRRLEKVEGELKIKPIEDTVRKVVDEGEALASKLSPINMVELEKAIGVAAQEAIKAYTEAICSLKDQADQVYRLVEESVEKVDARILNKIKIKTEERDELIRKAEDAAKAATESIAKLICLLEDPDFPGDEEMRNMAKRNIERVLKAVEDAKNTLEQEKARVSVTDKYWARVQEARRHFSEELEILFPSLKLSEKNMKLSDSDLDLFILYAFQIILYYQKELNKIDTISKLKLNKALEKSKLGDPKAIECAVEAEMDKERRKIGLEFQKRMFTLRAECERDMRLQMKRQAEAHSDHLVEAMKMKEKEIERKMMRKLDEEILIERNRFKTQMAGMIGRLKGLDDTMRKRASEDKKAQQSQILWSACQSLEAALRGSSSGICGDSNAGQLRPLQNEINAISKAAAPGDELVEAVVNSIPPEVSERGVYTEGALRDRFLKVERVAKRVALLPDGGASIPVMFLSYLQSLFIITGANPIPSYELANEPFEPAKFNTFDILQRARFWMDRGDFAQCLRYMNLLEGAPRAVAREWMKEARILLETQQAAQALMAHASASGLVYS